VRIVRARSAGHRSDIEYLQAITLPHDQLLPTNVGVWWVVYDGTDPVAFAGLLKSHRWSDAMYLCRSGVLESHRGKGIQKRLIRVRERHARSLNMRWLLSDTRDNFPSANSLIAEGFQLFRPTRPWGFKNALYWRKRIAP
jgi:GNAT superfamily N-acetyltransferase